MQVKLWQNQKVFIRSRALIPCLTCKKEAQQTNKTLHTLISYNYEEACNQLKFAHFVKSSGILVSIYSAI